ncbi:radical SAM protein [Geomonas sp. Red32]|uniref:radical SAM protein n=1 Tax=Geomonas sp. Red32 TaxID=2912856 RepID=UPI00202CB19D|nr:radical SAM protein [Geomonas sp. Red32]
MRRDSLPPAVCFRVSRHCNARCRFCLAPPDGITVSEETLKARLDWLFSAGVRSIHFCGGEPAIHPALPGLLRHVAASGAKSRVTTNGIEVSDDVAAALQESGTHVKVSLHGDRNHHNGLVGCDGFDRTVATLRMLQVAKVPVSVQTTLVAGGGWVLDWAIDFCLRQKIKRLSFLPFVARGRGVALRDQLALSSGERASFLHHVKQARRLLSNRLDVRWLDMRSSRLCVIDVDGRIVIERGSEVLDLQLGNVGIPARPR